MSARTARDKLRVAHELRRRPLVADVFASGRLSYCKVRAITRVVGDDAEVDRWLLRLAEAGTVADLDRAVRHWASLEEQERAWTVWLRECEHVTVVSYNEVASDPAGTTARVMDALGIDAREAAPTTVPMRRPTRLRSLVSWPACGSAAEMTKIPYKSS